MPHKRRLIKDKLANPYDSITRLIPDEYNEEFIGYVESIKDHMYDSILFIINHPFLRNNLNDYLNVTLEEDKDDAIQLYELVKSKNFIQLLKTLNEIPIDYKKRLQLNIIRVFKDSNIENIALNIYRKIMEFVKGMLEPRASNTSVVYLSGKNVKASEDVEDLDISSFKKILENFDNFSYVQKKSSSNSIILTAYLSVEDANVIKVRDNLNSKKYYFKIFPVGFTLDRSFEHVQYNTGMLQFELVAYNELFKLVKYNLTPNILCKLHVGYFDNFYTHFYNNPKIAGKTKKHIREDAIKISDMVGSEGPWNKTGVIITHPGGVTLDEPDLFKNLTILERKMVMFQILYTLYVFEELEISHGDLHNGNIFIIDVPPTELCYVVQDTQYKFITTKIVKIYDFDHSTITSESVIRINTNKFINVNKILNPDRNPGEWLNNFAETNIFNKNLDICILITYGFRYLSAKSRDLEYMEDADPEFDNFIQDIMPGFDYRNYTSNEKIIDTYANIFKNREQLAEANIFYGVNIKTLAEIDQYNIMPSLFGITWKQYYDYISTNYGRIIKSTDEVQNNQLYIPDTVIIPKWQMLNHSYFDALTSMDTIDITSQIVYTIDGRIEKITEV
jgi:hypothetical protein